MNLARSILTTGSLVEGDFMSVLQKQHKFKDLDVCKIFSECLRKKYGLNKVLSEPQNIHQQVFFLVDGKVKVTNKSDKGRPVSAGYYHQGNFINLESTVKNIPKKYIAISKSKNTVVICISKNKFYQKINTTPQLQQYVINQLIVEKAESEQRLHRILDIKSNDRVYDFFYHHTLKFGQRVGYEYVIREPLTHQEIGEYIGSSRQTVTTSMNILRRKGILHFNRKYWIIRDLASLKKIVDEL